MLRLLSMTESPERDSFTPSQSRERSSGARASSPHRMRPGWPRSQAREPETEGIPVRRNSV
jgi:hypothetical protein